MMLSILDVSNRFSPTVSIYGSLEPGRLDSDDENYPYIRCKNSRYFY